MSPVALRAGNAPVSFDCQDGSVVSNGGPQTVYYRDEEPVTSSVNDGSLASGASATLAGVQFFTIDSSVAGAVASISVSPPSRPDPTESLALLASLASVTLASLRDTFASYPNGAPPLAVSGQAYTLTDSGHANAGLRVASGKLTNAATAGSNVAGYANVQLAQNVTRMGAKFTLSTGSSVEGAAVLAVFAANTVPTPVPNSPLHFVINRHTWGVDVIVGGVFTSLMSGNFATDLVADGATVHEAEAFIDYDQGKVTVILPDGSAHTATSAVVTAQAARWATFECYQLNAATDGRAAFTQLWADDTAKVRGRPSPDVVSVVRLAGALAEASKSVLGSASWAPGVSTPVAFPLVATGVNSALSVSFTVPRSGCVIVELGAYVEAYAGFGNYYFGVGPSSLVLSYAVRVLSFQEHRGWMTGRIRVTGLTPGSQMTYVFQHYADAANGNLYAQSAVNVPVMTVFGG